MRWTVGGLSIQDSTLELTAIEAFASGAPVAISAIETSFAPVQGAAEALIDGDGATKCVFTEQQVRAPGFKFVFYTADPVTSVRMYGTKITNAWLLSETGELQVYADNTAAGVTEVGANKPLSPELVAAAPAGFWALDDTGAMQRDRFGGRNGVRNGGRTTFDFRCLDTAAVYDPQAKGYVRIPGVSGIDSGPFTVMFDFSGSTPNNMAIVEHGTDNRGWSVQTAAAGQGIGVGGLWLQLGGQDAGGVVWYSHRLIADGAPHRICFAYRSATDVRIFIDGVLDTARTAGTPRAPVYNSTFIDVGTRGGFNHDSVPGRFANLAIFNRALADDEIVKIVRASPVFAQVAKHDVGTIDGLALPYTAHSQISAEYPPLDVEFGGHGHIYGVVELYNQAGNIPLPRRVRLHRSRDGFLVRETWSDARGNYSFTGISDRYKYDVIAWDHEGLQQSVVANDLTPEVMP